MKPKTLLLSLLAAFILTACSEESGVQKEIRFAKGGMQYGGVFHINEVENFRSLFPHSTGDINSYNIGSQIYEGLLLLDQKNLEVKPGLAESWEVSSDGMEYTFKIRPGINFHDDECFPEGIGREMNVEDVHYSLTQLCTPRQDNDLFSMVIDRIEGAREHYEAIDNGQNSQGVTGLNIIDENTYSIRLTEPFSGFLKILATASCWIYPHEAYETYGVDMRVNCVGTGPFKVVKIVESEVVILNRNNNYWRTDEYENQLPYLDALKYTFVTEKKSEIMEFKKGNLDMVYQIPVDELEELNIDAKEEKGEFTKDDYVLQITPSLSVQYYSFQHMSDEFSDIDVRKAFNYAIDKRRIVEYGLNGLGFPAVHGMVPPSIEEYPIDSVNGFSFSPEKAREHLAAAGYPKGEGFPRLTLQINSGGSANIAVAEIVQKMLAENLNVYVDLSVTSHSQHLDIVSSGKSVFWKEGWLADYSDPENFLCLFYGEFVPDDIEKNSFINSSRYKNDFFDKLYEKANTEQDPDKRMKLYCKADQKIINDAAVIPLYYEKTVRLLKPYVKNFPVNPMEYRDLASVYFDLQNHAASISYAD